MTDVRHLELRLEREEPSRRTDAGRALLEAVVRTLPVGVLIADAGTRRIVVANDLVTTMLGTDQVGQAIDEIDRPVALADDERTDAPANLPLARALDTGETTETKRLLYYGSSGPRLVALEAVPIRDELGHIIAAVAILEDVTERERQERAERDFVTNAAHELQTPLAAIASSVEVLQVGAKDDPAARDRFLQHIQAQTLRLGRLAHALLVLARAQMGVEEPKRVRFALRDLLDDIALGITPAAGVAVRVRCAARTHVTTNRELLEQALWTVAVNAAKYTASGEIRLTGRSESGMVAIEVMDTGPGLRPGSEEAIFARFYRGGRPTDGFGLGLAIAQQTVAALGGTIAARPSSGGGTVVRLTLPKRPA